VVLFWWWLPLKFKVRPLMLVLCLFYAANVQPMCSQCASCASCIISPLKSLVHPWSILGPSLVHPWSILGQSWDLPIVPSTAKTFQSTAKPLPCTHSPSYSDIVSEKKDGIRAACVNTTINNQHHRLEQEEGEEESTAGSYVLCISRDNPIGLHSLFFLLCQLPTAHCSMI
jgi:hypothetical protein